MHISDQEQVGFGTHFIWFFTCVYLMSTYLLTSVVWGKYMLLAMLFAVFFANLLLRGGVIHLNIDEFHVFMALFLGCAVLTSIWAWSSADTLDRCKSLLEIMLCTALLYIVYDGEGTVLPLLKILMWAGVLGAVFLFAYYGPSNILGLLDDSTRLEGQLWNTNTIARMMGTSLLVLVYFVMFHGWKWRYVLFALPLILIIVTQSRTVIIGDTVGIVILTAQKRRTVFTRPAMRHRTALGFLLVLIAFIAAFEGGLLDGTLERFDGLVSAVIGKGGADSSAEKRLEMVQIGLQQFGKTPLFGIGLDNGHYLAKARFGLDYYLHNNYIELLVGCGIFGALSYYVIYVYLLQGFYWQRNSGDVCLPACIAILLSQLLIDMGSVSYYKKDMYYVFLVCFLELKQLQRKTAVTVREDLA